jgi:hypothetical protein
MKTTKNVSVQTDIIKNHKMKSSKFPKSCLTCDKIPEEIVKKTGTITKQSGGSTGCTINTYYYCSICVPDSLPESNSTIIVGEVITDKQQILDLANKISRSSKSKK